MIEIGGKPILWHIMKIYSCQGYRDFVICLGYKGEFIKNYFLNYFQYNSDLTVDLEGNRVKIHQSPEEKFRITLVDTGLHTRTAGRLKRVRRHLEAEPFMLTYGDGLADINLREVLAYHRKKGKIGTVTAVQPGGRFGAIDISREGFVRRFKEKPRAGGSWINGGFFVLEPEVFDYLEGPMDEVMWEQAPLEKLVLDGQLAAYRHHGFWKCMDALRDKHDLEQHWEEGDAKWKIWERESSYLTKYSNSLIR